MRIVHRKHSLPKWWNPPSALSEFNVRMTRGSRLWLKVIVFKNRLSLRRFWKDDLDKGELGRSCLGATNQLVTEVYEFKDGRERRWLEVDKKYYCVMGLVKEYLTMEIITHESVHAGFAYARRVGKRSPFLKFDDIEEEQVCYPAGCIAGQINRQLQLEGMYE